METRQSRLFPQPAKAANESSSVNPGAVTLWRVQLDGVPANVREHLTAADWVEASRIVAVDERDRFLTARSVLRAILSKYLVCPPDKIAFSRDLAGALEIVEPVTTLRFHLSQAQNLLLVAVTFSRQLGLDVEFMRADLPFETLADHYFEPADAWRLRLLTPSERMQLFYDQWTSSEAQRQLANSAASSRWSLVNFSPAEGFSAALAVEGESFELNCCSWS